MLDYNTLQNKASIRIKNENEDKGYINCKDLLTSTFNTSLPLQGNICVVNKYYVARPDLISLAWYNDDKYADIICKLNGISNPFELNEDDILIMPPFEMIADYLTADRKPSELTNEAKIDENNVLTDLKKLVNEKRNPAEKTIEDNNYYIDKTNHLIFY